MFADSTPLSLSYETFMTTGYKKHENFFSEDGIAPELRAQRSEVVDSGLSPLCKGIFG